MHSFEAWCRLLLLDAVQRAGLFRQPGQSATLEDIVRLNRRPWAGHTRMVEACLDILTAAGFLRHLSLLTLPEQAHWYSSSSCTVLWVSMPCKM